MFSNSTLFGGANKRKFEDGEEPPAKHAKIENIPLSTIRHYKNEIYTLIKANLPMSPNNILLNLLLKKKKNDISKDEFNFFCDGTIDRKINPHADFENTLLSKLGSTPIVEAASDMTIVVIQNSKILDIIPIINVYLMEIKLKPNEELFCILIAFFYYYIECYRTCFPLHLEAVPAFKEQIFIPLEIYKRQHIAKCETQSVNLTLPKFLEVIESDSQFKTRILSYLRVLPLTEKQEENLLEKLAGIATQYVTIKENPNIQSIRKKACILIKALPVHKDITKYTNIAMSLYKFSWCQWVQKTGCELLGRVFPLVSKEQADDIFNKLIEVLERKKADTVKKGACKALTSIHLSPEQTDKVTSILFTFSRDKHPTLRDYIFRMDLSIDQFKTIIETGMRDDHIWGILDFVHLKERDSAIYEEVIDWFLKISDLNFITACEIFNSISIPMSRHKEVINRINNYIERPAFPNPDYSDCIKALAATKQVEADAIIVNTIINRLREGSVDLLNLPCVTAELFSTLTADHLSLLNKFILNQFEYAKEAKELQFFGSVCDIIEKFSLVTGIDNSAITKEYFPSTHLAIQILDCLSINMTFQDSMALDYCFCRQADENRNFYTSVVNEAKNLGFSYDRLALILHEKKFDTLNKMQLLNKLKQLLINYLIQSINYFSAGGSLPEKLCDRTLSLLGVFNGIEVQYPLIQVLFRCERSLGEKTWFDFEGIKKIYSELQEMTKTQIIPRNAFEHFNLICMLETENEQDFSFYKHHFIQALRKQTATMVAVEQIAYTKFPNEIVQQVKIRMR